MKMIIVDQQELAERNLGNVQVNNWSCAVNRLQNNKKNDSEKKNSKRLELERSFPEYIHTHPKESPLKVQGGGEVSNANTLEREEGDRVKLKHLWWVLGYFLEWCKVVINVLLNLCKDSAMASPNPG